MKPCEGCENYSKDTLGTACYFAKPGRCDRWEWYMIGLAEAESLVHKREQEIVEWVREQSKRLRETTKRDLMCATEALADALESWLQGKE